MPLADLMLETERLILRRLRPEDADAIFAVLGDPIAMQYYPRTFDRKDAEEWIERNLRRYTEYGHGLYAVVLKTSGDVVGDCGLVTQQIDGRPELEVGYHLRRDQWGHGYATEAARGCMDYAFRELAAAKVISLIRQENLPSRRVAERNGMRVERQVMHFGLMHLMYAACRPSDEERGSGRKLTADS
ncbi:MAG: GNAT family N-acetyltransferase [Candidatus Korobacteraceae bacterium]|jgi:RimJ/RimL family protein N-acetyltransferase